MAREQVLGELLDCAYQPWLDGYFSEVKRNQDLGGKTWRWFVLVWHMCSG
jgi:hypothetical protein